MKQKEQTESKIIIIGTMVILGYFIINILGA